MRFSGSKVQDAAIEALMPPTSTSLLNVSLATGAVEAKLVTEREWTTFETAKIAARTLKLKPTNVKNVLAGRSKSTGGYAFRYQGTTTSEIKEREVEAMGAKSRVWASYASARAASKSLDIPLVRINACLGGEAKTSKGHLFRYVVEEEEVVEAEEGEEGRLKYMIGRDQPTPKRVDKEMALTGPCFVNSRTKLPLKSYKKALETTARNAKLHVDEAGESRRIFPYLLRHSFATLAATSNPPVPLPVAQKVMRHTSSKMLLDVYARAGTMIMREGLNNFNL